MPENESGEVIITESEYRNDPAFDEEMYFSRIAKHFFNQFLELKIKLDRGDLAPPPDDKAHEKEVRQYKKVIDELRKAAADLAAENRRFEEELAVQAELNTDLRRQLNEALINLGQAQEKLSGLGLVRNDVRRMEREGYNFLELMSDESRKAFESMMKGIPYGGTKDTE